MSNSNRIAEADVAAATRGKASMRSSTLQNSGDRQRHYAQFFTPVAIANLMASFFEIEREEVRVLDAGAGTGALTKAIVRRYCNAAIRPSSINVILFEVDDVLIPELRASMLLCEQQCLAAHIAFSFKIENEDFVLCASRDLELFGRRLGSFSAAIVNPPYQKIRSDSAARAALSSTGIKTTNLYTGFLALILRLLEPGGELVAITPRSFCNGAYFRPFRADLLESVAVKRLHVFESRKAAFVADGVLQENVILYAVKNAAQESSLIVSSSDGSSGGAIAARKVAFSDVVNKNDSEKFIHLPVNDALANAKRVLRLLTSSLADLGITVSTGRVVDFRARDFLKNEPGQRTAPLIYPAHLDGMSIRWPLVGGRKANAIAVTEDTQGLLVQSGVYVLTKRFTTKEERKRVVASVFDPEIIPDPLIAFENHLNYFHQDGRGLPRELAQGLAVYLNSSFVDLYLRRFSGHTQVNATDLRSLPYPDRDALNRLGGHAHQVREDQRRIDDAVERELAAR